MREATLSWRFRPIHTEEYWTQQLKVWGTYLVLLCGGIPFLALIFGFNIALQMLMLLGLALTLLKFNTPIGVFGLGILCVLDPFARVYILEGGFLRWNSFNYLLLIIIAFHTPFLLRWNTWQYRAFQALVLIMLVQLMQSVSIVDGIQEILGVVSFIGLLCGFAYVGSPGSGFWNWFSLITATLSTSLGFVFLLLFKSLSYINPNAWSYAQICGLFAIFLGLKFSKSSRDSSILILLAFLNMLIIFLSGSRGSMILGLAALLFIFFEQRASFTRRVFYIIVATISAAVMLTVFVDFQSVALERIANTFDTSRTLANRTSGRIDLFIGGWNIFLENPLGVGTGNFREAWVDIGTLNGALSSALTGSAHPAHSGWIVVLSEHGIPGFICLLGFLLPFLRAGWQQRRQDMFVLGLFVFVSLSLAWLTTEYQTKSIWMLAAAACVLLYNKGIQYNLLASRRQLPLTVRDVIRPPNF
jgi:O-antigen ligase